MSCKSEPRTLTAPGRACVLLGALAAGGCSGGEGRSEGSDFAAVWEGSMRDSAGVMIVENTARGLLPTDAWTFTERTRIGSESDPDYQFGQVSGVELSADGHVFVVDQQAQNVRMFSPAGELVATLGSPGSGPGQLGVGAGPILEARDTLFVPDISNQRVNRITSDGELAGSFNINFADGFVAAWNVDDEGRLVTQVRRFALSAEAEPDTMDVIVTRDTEGAVIDTLFSMASGKTFELSGDGPRFRFFVSEPIWTLREDGTLVFGLNDRYSLEAYEDDGSLERVIRMPFERRPVTLPDQQVLKESIERIWREAGVPPEAMRNLVDAIEFAEFFPAYARFIPGPQNTLWVQHTVTPGDLSEEERENFNPQLSLGAPEWDVFGPDGRFLGVAVMPARFQPFGFDGQQVYGVWRDELDVQHVTVYQVGGFDTSVPTESATE